MKRFAIKITALYAFFGAIWIFFSDRFLEIILVNPNAFTRVQTYKGWFFISATAVLLYVFARNAEIRQLEKEKALSEGEARFQSLFAKAPLAYQSLSPQGHLLQVNHAWEELIGYPADIVLGKWFGDFLLPSERQKFQRCLESLPSRDHIHKYAIKIQNAETNAIHVEMEGKITRNVKGNLVQVHCILQDITKRIQAEEALRESEEKYKGIVENSQDGILILQDFAIVFCNQHALKIFGALEEKEILNRDIYSLIDSNDLLTMDAELEKHLLDESYRSHFFLQAKRFDQTSFETEFFGSKVLFRGKPAAQFVIHDLSPQRRLEQMVNQAQKMEAIGQLSSGIAHDFNNLLTAILGQAELIQMQLNETDPFRKEIDTIFDAATRAADLTNSILTFSKKRPLTPKITNPAIVMNHLHDMIDRVVSERIEVFWEIEKKLWDVRIAPHQLDQILMNLVINAADAMLDGGKLVIRMKNSRIDDLQCSACKHPFSGDFFEIEVQDNGIGIPSGIQKRLFEPFFTTKGEGKGTGLGLASVFGIVTHLKGHIRVESQVSIGTNFRIFLPKVEKSSFLQKEFAFESLEKLRGNEIILVIHEELTREHICKALEAYEYCTIPLTESEDMQEQLSTVNVPPNLIILPAGSSAEAALQRIWPDVPFCRTIATEQAKYAPDEIRLPFTQLELVSRVRHLLNRQKQPN